MEILQENQTEYMINLTFDPITPGIEPEELNYVARGLKYVKIFSFVYSPAADIKLTR